MKLLEQLADAFLNGAQDFRFVYNRMTKEVDILEMLDNDWEDDDNLELVPYKESREMYEVMVDFSNQYEGELEEKLFQALNGRKPFHAFRETANSIGIINAWYDYEQEYVKKKMQEWLESL
ncbi:UPF0158 family protein [Solibacillus sp. MA9]|uniref:UPF0158 family protein n=1 Tax=Solibacillus palustris TaxID=2908203 RepID=A0ABS9UG85_9BACL|nr:UPF0158 family protein [Solibacillus sp. MA9]MCH7322973.1 UPF0158 family protein [Solibacillus sp. MA9]